jgi:ElaA protein
MKTTCRRVEGDADMAASMTIRESVFIGEQNVPEHLERDGLDGECLHYLATINGKPVATARVMLTSSKFKFQRVAVMKSARGTGIGAQLMRYMMDDLAKRDDAGDKVFFLSSQVSAIGFYALLGFEVCSDEYMDAGIAHRDMKRSI